MTSTATPDRVRLTITVTSEVHTVFSRMADAAGLSLGRAMGDWLEDTLEAAQFTATKMEEARSAPRIVAREMHAYALGLADETGQVLASVREKAAAQRASAAPRSPIPPSSNTGGKVPRAAGKSGGKSR